MNAYLSAAGRKRARAFTLLELLVVLGLLALGGMMLLPALARTNPNTYPYQCLNNQKQLMAAWAMYAADHNDTLPSSESWVSGWLDWNISSDNTNATLMLNSPGGLGRYVKSALPFKCPTDVYLSSAQRTRGWAGRVRSLSMNSVFGAGSNPFLGNYQQWLKLDQVPQPGNFWVLTEEHPDSINDGRFLVNLQTPSSWIDLPASLHQAGSCLAFADGRAEMHKWLSKTIRRPVFFFEPVPIFDPLSPQDFQWLSSRTSAPK